MDEEIFLGFPDLEKSDGYDWLTNRYFPCKIGGRPAWLELNELPTNADLQCNKCQLPKAFLCQIYAAYNDEHNFHRSIYVFICRSPQCQESNVADNFTVLRSQLPRANDYYPQEPPSYEGKPLAEIPTEKNLCLACGCVGPHVCGRCKQANYCSAYHQRAHWPHHKKTCANKNIGEVAVALPIIVFPECEIEIDVNAESVINKTSSGKIKDDMDAEEKRLEQYKQLVAEGKTGVLSDVTDVELDKYVQSTDNSDDKHFEKFKKEVDKDPEQIIRYQRGGQPLWIADVEKTVGDELSNIPNCELCGSERQFEFQIMPQMLLLLKDEHLDWGILAVYTCTKGCKIPSGAGYVREYIIKQDIVETKL